ncbi:hypothetical protein ABDJ41_19950 [Pedobacter sp. ASV1-7]|uniref:hypothetical protein n=1 Tax=Pedobacter sp. ASV1-7 TaxID=3145237 RepID=UPI0032E8DD0C
MNKTIKLKAQLEETRLPSRKTKDPNLKGRKYKGSPYLKLKKVKAEPRIKIRQLLRSFVPLEQFKPPRISEQTVR